MITESYFVKNFLLKRKVLKSRDKILGSIKIPLIKNYLVKKPESGLSIFNIEEKKIRKWARLIAEFYAHDRITFLIDCSKLAEGLVATVRLGKPNKLFIPDFDIGLSQNTAFIVMNIGSLRDKPTTQDAFYYMFLVRWFDSYRYLPMIICNSTHNQGTIDRRIATIVKSCIQCNMRRIDAVN